MQDAALALFYERCAGPIVYGENDCAMTAGDVLVAAGRADPMAYWRGRYRTARGFLRIIRKEGAVDLPAAVEWQATEMGWKAVDPSRGRDMDLGLVAFWMGQRQLVVPAICWRRFWLARTDYGALVWPVAVKAWRTEKT